MMSRLKKIVSLIFFCFSVIALSTIFSFNQEFIDHYMADLVWYVDVDKTTKQELKEEDRFLIDEAVNSAVKYLTGQGFKVFTSGKTGFYEDNIQKIIEEFNPDLFLIISFKINSERNNKK